MDGFLNNLAYKKIFFFTQQSNCTNICFFTVSRHVDPVDPISGQLQELLNK